MYAAMQALGLTNDHLVGCHAVGTMYGCAPSARHTRLIATAINVDRASIARF